MNATVRRGVAQPDIEYLAAMLDGAPSKDTEQVNRWAAEGWRLVTVSDGVAYLERRRPAMEAK